MQHHMQLIYGDSNLSQGHAQWTDPMTGIGQGNGAGPHIWAVASTPLFQILTKEGFLAQIICAMSKHQSAMASFGFVDDIDLCIMDVKGVGKQVVRRMQESINMWVGLLHATSGALVPEKCFWYYIHNTWSHGKWQYSKNPATQAMYVMDDNDQQIKIPQVLPSEAWRTLGVHLALDRNNINELHYLLEVAKSWQTLMSAANPCGI